MEWAPPLPSLFHAPVAICTVDAHTPLDPLTVLESSSVGPRWSSKRIWDYQAGRHCARRALRQLGIASECVDLGLESDDRGVPRWPRGIAGSITHTGRGADQFAACVVSRALRAVGIDAERDVPLRSELQARVLTKAEREFVLGAFDSTDAASRHALLVFSAKESFYKCQFALTGTYLGFQDVETRFDFDTHSFVAWSPKNLGSLGSDCKLPGRYSRADGMVLTTVFYE